MSTFVPVDVDCPQCGATRSVTVALSLNVGRSPARRQELLDGALHRSTCARCGVESAADVGFTYLDFDRKQLLVVHPSADEGAWPTLEGAATALFERNLREAALPERVRERGEGFLVRCVFGLAALREKVLVFACGLDDRAVEITKLAWMRGDLARLELAARPRAYELAADELRLASPGRRLGGFSLDVAEAKRQRVDEALAKRIGAGPYVDLGRLWR